MAFIILIFIAAILIFACVLMAPITFFGRLTFDAPPLVTVGFHFLFFKHHFTKGKKEDQAKTRRADRRSDKSRKVKHKGRSEKPSTGQLLMLIRKHEIIRQTLAAFVDCIKKFFASADRYYINANLSGGFRSPDITGQVYGFVQICRSIPCDSVSVTFHPDFKADKPGGTIVAGTVFKPYQLIILLMMFFLRLPKVKLIKLYRSYKKGDSYV